MYHVKLIKGASYTGIVSATKANPDVFIEDKETADKALATGYFELVNSPSDETSSEPDADDGENGPDADDGGLEAPFDTDTSTETEDATATASKGGKKTKKS